MQRTLILCCALIGFAAPLAAQETGALNLPYEAPGRGVVDHDAVMRRSLDVLEGQFGAFRATTATLAENATDYCAGTVTRDHLITGFEDAWLAWAPLDSYQFGPIEQTGAALRVNFWPDKKNFVGRALRDVLALDDAALRDAATFAAASAGAEGFPALERLIEDPDRTCPAVIGLTAHLNAMAVELYDLWFAADGWADLARAAGPDNPVYLSKDEFTKTLYTALDFGLTRIADARLGRPLGTFDRPFPTRAEAWRSGLTNRIIAAQLDGIAQMIRFGFAGDIREPDRAWVLRVVEQAQDRLAALPGPIADIVEDPKDRFHVEALQTKIHYLQSQMAQVIGPNLGVDTGFSAADGD